MTVGLREALGVGVDPELLGHWRGDKEAKGSGKSGVRSGAVYLPALLDHMSGLEP